MDWTQINLNSMKESVVGVEEQSSEHEESTNLQVISIHTSSNKIHKTELKYHRRTKAKYSRR